MKKPPKKLEKKQADFYARLLLDGQDFHAIPADYQLDISRGLGRVTVKLSDLYGNCFVYSKKLK